MKIKILIPLFILILAGYGLIAQALDQRLIVGLSFGAGLPKQNFGKSDTIGRKDTTKVKGWATTGINFNLRVGYRLKKHIGVMALAGGDVNWFNTTAYLNQNFNFPVLQGSVVVNAKVHYIGSYLVGPFFNFPVGKLFKAEGHVLAGVMTVSYASVDPIINYDGSTYTYTDVYKMAYAFGYDVGATLKYNLIDEIALTLNADYLGGNPSMTGYSISYTGPAVAPPGPPPASSGSARKSVMSTGIINLNVGAIFTFF
jgi:hypothetical protein